MHPGHAYPSFHLPSRMIRAASRWFRPALFQVILLGVAPVAFAQSADTYEPDDTAGTAKSIAAGATQNRTIHTVGNVDWATFTLTQISEVTIETAGPSGDTIIYLYGPGNSTNLIESDDDGNGTFSRITRTIAKGNTLAAGAYYVKIEEYDNNGTIAAYTLRLSVAAGTISADAYEPDDTAASAKTITAGNVQNRTIHAAGNPDWATFTVTQTSAVTIETDGTAGDTIAYLYGPNSSTTLITSDDDSGNGSFSKITRAATNALAAATYYIKVVEYGEDGTIPAYTLALTTTTVTNAPATNASTVKPVTSVSSELPMFVNNADARYRAKARLSGDGRKLVLVKQPSSRVSGYALTTWLGGMGAVPPGTNDLPEVLLYDIATRALKSVFVGTQATRQAGGSVFMTQLFDNVAADLNRDGSRAAVTYTDHRMTYSATGVAQSLLVEAVIKLIDTASGATLFEKRLETAGLSPSGIAIRLNQDGTRAVFLHHPRGAATRVFAVDYYDEAPAALYSLVLSGSAAPTKLSEGDGVTAPKLYNFQHSQYSHFTFDLDSAGNRVVFNYETPRQVIGVNFDGSGRHVISTNTDIGHVALTRDGDHVAYTRTGATTEESSFLNAFAGGAERPLVSNAVESASGYGIGPLILGDDGGKLALSSRAAGGYYRPVSTEPSITINWWGGTLLDASDDLDLFLTESVPLSGSQFTSPRTYYLSRFETDEDRDGLGDDWERQQFGNLAENTRGDNDADGLRNDYEYQLGTNPRNRDTDGDGLDDSTEFVRSGTDPLDSRSRLAVETVAVANGQVSIRWNSVNGRSYRIESAASLGGTNTWQNRSGSISGTGSAGVFTVSPTNQAKSGFYRLVLE